MDCLYIIVYFLRRIFIGFWRLVGFCFPHKKMIILFDSYLGKQYSCNPKYIYEYMLEHFPKQGIRYVWAFREPGLFTKYLANNTAICRFYSLRHLWYACIADVQITNFNLVPSEGRKQIRVQTWHGGGCYKKVGKDISYNSKWYNWYVQQKYQSFTCFPDHVIREQFAYPGEILNFGLPRNDILIHADKYSEKADDIRDTLCIEKNEFVILYAPTYRDIQTDLVEEIDFNLIMRSVNERFGRKATILFRGHHFSSTVDLARSVKDVSSYPDMQELLLISDMLISDYSSSIWDYSFLGRPCFLYTPDLDEYTRYRGFDVDIQEWGFPVCRDNASLRDNILTYNEPVFRDAMSYHHKTLVSYDGGDATKKLCMYLAELLHVSIADS